MTARNATIRPGHPDAGPSAGPSVVPPGLAGGDLGRAGDAAPPASAGPVGVEPTPVAELVVEGPRPGGGMGAVVDRVVAAVLPADRIAYTGGDVVSGALLSSWWRLGGCVAVGNLAVAGALVGDAAMGEFSVVGQVTAALWATVVLLGAMTSPVLFLQFDPARRGQQHPHRDLVAALAERAASLPRSVEWHASRRAALAQLRAALRDLRRVEDAAEALEREHAEALRTVTWSGRVSVLTGDLGVLGERLVPRQLGRVRLLRQAHQCAREQVDAAVEFAEAVLASGRELRVALDGDVDAGEYARLLRAGGLDVELLVNRERAVTQGLRELNTPPS